MTSNARYRMICKDFKFLINFPTGDHSRYLFEYCCARERSGFTCKHFERIFVAWATQNPSSKGFVRVMP